MKKCSNNNNSSSTGISCSRRYFIRSNSARNNGSSDDCFTSNTFFETPSYSRVELNPRVHFPGSGKAAEDGEGCCNSSSSAAAGSDNSRLIVLFLRGSLSLIIFGRWKFQIPCMTFELL